MIGTVIRLRWKVLCLTNAVSVTWECVDLISMVELVKFNRKLANTEPLASVLEGE